MVMIAGVDVRRPNAYSRTSTPVRADTQLASGKVVRYQPGVRAQFSLSWRNARADLVATVEAIGLRGGTFPYVDELTGRTYLVMVDGFPTVSAVAGTDPVRHDVDLVLIESDVRRG